MARIAVADGIEITACTPHIHRGVYDNDGPGSKPPCGALQAELDRADIPLQLVCGADAHIDGDLVDGPATRAASRASTTPLLPVRAAAPHRAAADGGCGLRHDGGGLVAGADPSRAPELDRGSLRRHRPPGRARAC